MESMLCQVLIGRSAELGTLADAVGSAGQGRGSTLFLTGDAGVGKSRLTREIAGLGADRGFLVLTGRSTESAVPVPFRPITEALMGAARAGVVPDAPGIADYRAALGTLVPEWSRPGLADAEVSPVIIGEALLRILTQPGSPGGLLILEDLHWADPETLAIVEYLADNIATAGAVCLGTLRDSEPSPCLDLMHSVTARRAATQIPVRRLTRKAVTEMAAACLDTADVPRALSRLLADCDGLPFAVEEILAAAVSSGELVHGQSGWEVDDKIVTAMPASILGSVRNRLAALGPAARNVLVSAAVLGRQFDWALLPGVADAPAGVVLQALHEAHEVQLIEPVTAEASSFRFRHSLTRSAIISDLLPPDLARRAARAATAIEDMHPDLPGGWCEQVAELRATAGQPVQAARLLLTAGRRALGHGALTSAIDALHDAQKLLVGAAAVDAELDIEIDEALAEAFSLTGDYEQLGLLAEDLLSRLQAAGADPRRQALIRIRTASTRPEDNAEVAAAHLAAAGDIAQRLDDPELGSRIDSVAARYALVTGELDLAGKLADRALAAAAAAALEGWAAEVALESLDVLGRRERTRDLPAARSAFERALQVAEERELGVWRIKMMHELATTDLMTTRSADGLLHVRELAHEAGILSTAITIDLQLANLWSLGTNLDAALEAAQQSARGAAQLRSPLMEALALCAQGTVYAVQGNTAAAERVARQAEQTMPEDRGIQLTTWANVRALAALFRDDVPRADRLTTVGLEQSFQALSARRRSRGFYSLTQVPLLARGRSFGVAALVQAVTGGDARAAIERAEASGAGLVTWNRGCLGYAEAVLAGRAGDRDRATALAAEGAQAFAPFAPWWNHLAQRLVATDALRDGWGEPVAWMREAAVQLEASGHDRLASACRGILRKAGERVPRSGRGAAQVPPQLRRLGVTSREMDVYLLVARGCSNAEIAERLFISPKTVETHIANLVLKTGQAGRRELVAHAARFGGS